MKYVTLIICVCSLTACNDGAVSKCNDRLSSAVSKIVLLASSDEVNVKKVASNRQQLRRGLKQCDLAKDGLKVPMLGHFGVAEMYIFTLDNKKFAEYIRNHKDDLNRTNGAMSVLGVAARYGSKQMVHVLLKSGFSSNASGAAGDTAMMAAMNALKSRFEKADLLLKYKANINAEDKKGLSVLDWAIVDGDVEAVRYLLARGATIDCNPTKGPSTLELAQNAKNKKLLSLLSSQRQSCSKIGGSATTDQ